VPPLPVLPGGIGGGGARLLAPGPVDGPQVGRARGRVGGPAEAVQIVELALGGVAEERVGGDNETVALEASGRR
jgi:hypothetical protein